MNVCKLCKSTKIFKAESKSFIEDSHNIVEVFVCQECGHKENKLVNIQEGSHGKRNI